MNKVVCLAILLYKAGLIQCSEFYTRTFSVPLKVFDGKTTYICIAQPIAADQYMVEFQPLFDTDGIKHMSISMCDEPFSKGARMWDCLQPYTTCKSRRDPMYGWTHHAPGLKFSANAGMHTGNRPRYMVFQMHGSIKGITGPGANKTSGMTVKFRSSKPKYNVYLAVIGNDGKIPPNVKGYKTDSSCMYNNSQQAPIFGYALHSHSKGRTEAGYIIRNGKWIEIGKGDPRYPTAFFDMTHRNMYLQKGDIVVVRCTFDNPTNHYIKFGHTEDDEMCNFFIYYGIAMGAPADGRTLICSNDAMTYHWEDHFDDIPSDSTDISGDTDQRLFAKSHKQFVPQY